MQLFLKLQTQKGYFIKRYKRFLVDIEINKQIITCYCPNPGKMADILVVGSPVLLIQQNNSKYLWRWVAIYINNCWIGTDTHIPNKLAGCLLPQLYPNQQWKSEVKHDKHRFDFESDDYIVEVKNVHWKQGQTAYFPDCITKRGASQINQLAAYTHKNKLNIYIIQRHDVINCAIASDIDPNYSTAIKNFINHDGKIRCFSFQWSIDGIRFHKELLHIM